VCSLCYFPTRWCVVSFVQAVGYVPANYVEPQVNDVESTAHQEEEDEEDEEGGYADVGAYDESESNAPGMDEVS
jgi:hypothetical protein